LPQFLPVYGLRIQLLTVDPDFTKLIGFEWDAGNSSKSLTKHRVTAQEAEQAFADPNVHVLDDEAHSVSERRWKVFGKTSASRFIVVSFTIRGLFVRVISARPMNRKERKAYEKASA
jgi:uncharacterized protein